MIRTGDVLHNPVTGELIQFLTTAADTDGEYVEIEVVVEPNGFVAAAHVHPYQTERFTIVSGRLTFKAGDREFTALPGEEVVVEPGTPHRFWNEGGEDARFRCRISPALSFEALIETMFGLANDGKTNKKGMPNPLRLAVIAKAHFDVVQLPFPPAWLQKSGLAMGAPLGRLFGYKPAYEPSAAAAESLAV